MRCPELLRLRWSSVKWEKRTVTVEPRTAKVKTSRVLPLNAEALAVLKAWTLENGVVYREGQSVGNTGNVTELLWYGGKMWHFGSGAWYVNDDVRNHNGEWQSCVADPRTPMESPAGTFHGVNGHFDYLYTPDEVVAMLKHMGCTIYRVGCWDNEQQITAVTALAKAFQAAGLTLFVLVNQGVNDPATNEIFKSADDAYVRGKDCGRNVATALRPYGVTMYECGNELTRSPGIIVDLHYAGNIITDFNNDNWPVMRQVMRGMIDGVMEAQPDARCGMKFLRGGHSRSRYVMEWQAA